MGWSNDMRKIIGSLILVMLLGGVALTVWSLQQTPAPNNANTANTAQDFSPTQTDKTTTSSKGELVVASEPTGVRILFDLKDTGHTTPFVFANLEPGTYAVRLESDNTYPWSAELQVAAGEKAQLKAMLYRRTEPLADSFKISDMPLTLQSSLPSAGQPLSATLLGAAPQISLNLSSALDKQTADAVHFVVQIRASPVNLVKQVNYAVSSHTVQLVLALNHWDPQVIYQVIFKAGLTTFQGKVLPVDVLWEFGPGSITDLQVVSQSVDANLDEIVADTAKKARDNQRRDDLAAIQRALADYFVVHQAFPPSHSEADVFALSSALVPVYLTRLPHDPNLADTEKRTGYLYQSDGNAWTLRAELEYYTSTTSQFVVLTSL